MVEMAVGALAIVIGAHGIGSSINKGDKVYLAYCMIAFGAFIVGNAFLGL